MSKLKNRESKYYRIAKESLANEMNLNFGNVNPPLGGSNFLLHVYSRGISEVNVYLYDYRLHGSGRRPPGTLGTEARYHWKNKISESKVREWQRRVSIYEL